jgi:hypothetical protein
VHRTPGWLNLGLVAAIPLVALLAFFAFGRGGISVDGPVIAHHKGWFGGASSEDAGLGGTLSFVDHCLLLDDEKAIVWPDGTTWDAERQEVVLSNGETVGIGDHITGGGGVGGQEPDKTEQWRNSDIGKATVKCRTDDAGVAIFNVSEAIEVTKSGAR